VLSSSHLPPFKVSRVLLSPGACFIVHFPQFRLADFTAFLPFSNFPPFERAKPPVSRFLFFGARRMNPPDPSFDFKISFLDFTMRTVPVSVRDLLRLPLFCKSASQFLPPLSYIQPPDYCVTPPPPQNSNVSFSYLMNSSPHFSVLLDVTARWCSPPPPR